jgi:hypothetical protein
VFSRPQVLLRPRAMSFHIVVVRRLISGHASSTSLAEFNPSSLFSRYPRSRHSSRPLSEHDMDFDWADETIHASYGKHWLKELLAIQGRDPADHDRIREHCGKLVNDYVNTATADEVGDIKKIANALMVKAAQKLR